eukprot:CAMPEP_0118978326 /NCGR_PEP_ID=MMETSP1173-20130426/23385_1 /TAXON_ID=1034831 /ORGANISM="Rhizochromulina marina cf, Strain CCMP1243" /LENGTH=54 /DNA_ID=CAMNT_0006928511 /DNA_START=1 /DNA_END=162 /DNA_ORIENTATION=-
MEAMLNLDYPKDKLHIWVCDDGYTRAVYKGDSPCPEVTVNQRLIQSTGDVREEL